MPGVKWRVILLHLQCYYPPRQCCGCYC